MHNLKLNTPSYSTKITNYNTDIITLCSTTLHERIIFVCGFQMYCDLNDNNLLVMQNSNEISPVHDTNKLGQPVTFSQHHVTSRLEK